MNASTESPVRNPIAIKPYGATPAQWVHFSDTLMLTRHLLPVVSNPNALISPHSSLRSVGKMPSVYNRHGHAAGLPSWTSMTPTLLDIDEWAAQPDYGLCVQTRLVRAFDIDIEDETLANEVVEAITQAVDDATLPMRYRSNSSKCLLAFTLAGEYTKRILRTAGGAIEFLADGQQFVACGTHPSGVRYEWSPPLPEMFPPLEEEQFEAIWSMLTERFGVADAVETRLSVKGQKLSDAVTNDPIAQYLIDKDLVLRQERDGRLHIECPWSDEHTDNTGGNTSTTYWPAHTGGYVNGHFRCLHAHCEHRTDNEFLEALGYVDESVLEEFEALDDTKPVLSKLRRDDKGRILSTIENVVRAVACPVFTGLHVARDEFRDELMIAPAATTEWRPLADSDLVELRMRLAHLGFKPVGRELIRDAVDRVAADDVFDSAILWLDLQRWDGEPRVERFLSQYFRAEDTPYTRAVSLYIWTALAGRVLAPGVKADMVPILVGAQGAGKSTGVAAMVPSPDHYFEVQLDAKETDTARLMRGRLVGEIGELRGLHSRDIEHIKAFVTRTHESWIPKFREFGTTFPRRCIFVGTTNQTEFLADETGERRFLPVDVGRVDVKAIESDRLQLWAEGAARFMSEGVAWRDAEKLARGHHDRYKMIDAWQEEIVEHLESWPEDITIRTVLHQWLRIPLGSITKAHERRAGGILRTLGYKSKIARIDGEPSRVWRR